MRVLQERFGDGEATLRLLLSTLDGLPHSVSVLDAHGVIVLVNGAWQDFGARNGLGDRASGVGGDYLAACRAAVDEGGEDADTARQTLQGIADLREGRADRFTVEYPCHSPRQRRWFQVSGTAVDVEGEQGPWVVLVHEDVTARHLSLDALVQKRTGARTLEREADLRLLAGLSSGRLRLAMEFMDAAPYLDSLFAAFSAQLPENNRRLTKRILGPLPVLLDPRAFFQALLELLLNAYAATEPGGHIHLEAQQEDGRVTVCIMDDGHGLDVQDLSARLEAVDVGQEPEGVGLALVKVVMEHHGGRMSLASDGVGAVAILTLPVHKVEPEARP